MWPHPLNSPTVGGHVRGWFFESDGAWAAWASCAHQGVWTVVHGRPSSCWVHLQLHNLCKLGFVQIFCASLHKIHFLVWARICAHILHFYVYIFFVTDLSRQLLTPDLTSVARGSIQFLLLMQKWLICLSKTLLWWPNIWPPNQQQWIYL